MTLGLSVQIRKFGRLFVVLCFMILSAIGLFYAQSKLFEIQKVEVIGSGVTIQLDEEKIAKNLLFFPSGKVRAMLMAENSLLADVRFIKKYPHTLLIEPVVRTPIARLVTQSQIVLVDSVGIVVPGDPQQTLPVLTFDVGMVHEGQKLSDPRVLQSLRFVETMQDPWAIDTVTTQDGTTLIAVYDKSDILFTQDAPIPTLTSTLQTLLTGFRIKGSLPKIIDLRFDKPIVRF